MSIGSRFTVAGVLIITATVGFASSAQVPDGVSPGAVDHMAAIEGRCPSFSWGVVAGADYYQLVCYRLPEWREPSAVDLELAEQVFLTEVPGAATSWTPNLAQCLRPGERYVWFVRAVFREDDGKVVDGSEWSYGSFFEISPMPSAGEVEDALRLLRRYSRDGDGGADSVDPHEVETGASRAERSQAARQTTLPSDTAKSVSSAKTAIRGTLSDTTGETYGVVGVSSSVEGAGMGAAGAAGGPDLVLDGSVDLVPDTELSQSGIDRPSAAPQTFDIENSGGGGMTLQVEGVDVLTTASAIDADTLDGFDSADFATDVELALHAASADHDGRYFTEDELSTSGGGGSVHWDNVTSVPGDLADGDDDTLAILPGTRWGLHTVTTVDSVGYVGQHTSITVGADGLPVVSYFDDTNNDLKVAHCSDLACTTATTNTVDDGGGNVVGLETSIAIGADGLPIVSYYDDTNDDLKVAHCTDVACTSATASVVDSGGSVGEHSSITVGADGLPVVSYYDGTNHYLKVAHCTDVACTSAAMNVVDSGYYVGGYSSITVGADGLPIMSYQDSYNLYLKVAHCTDVACTSATKTTIDAGLEVGYHTSIAVGADGLPIMSYGSYFDSLRVAHCSNVACTSAAIRAVETKDYSVSSTSITVGADSLPVISYNDWSTDDLKVAHCSDPSCTTATLTAVDTGGDVGSHCSIAVGADGLPVISYHDVDNKDLKVVHCGNVFCIPYARTR